MQDERIDIESLFELREEKKRGYQKWLPLAAICGLCLLVAVFLLPKWIFPSPEPTNPTYDPPTAQLLDGILADQGILYSIQLSSIGGNTWYQQIRSSYPVLAELESRTDAADVLFQKYLFLQAMDPADSPDVKNCIRYLLSQKTYKDALSEDQLTLLSTTPSFPYFTIEITNVTDVSNNDSTRITADSFRSDFPKRHDTCFGLQIYLTDNSLHGNTQLRVNYGNVNVYGSDEHIYIGTILPLHEESGPYGHSITGWFDEVTEMELLLYDENENLLQCQHLRITPYWSLHPKGNQFVYEFDFTPPGT